MDKPDNQQARVIATFGRRLGLLLADGTEVQARIKGRRIQPVCGDRVEASALPNESDWLIGKILPRDNELTRPNMRGKIEILAANLDALVIVVADVPVPDWFIVDRYICAAELIGAAASVVFNKTDLGDIEETSARELEEYARIGYATLRCSARHDANIEALLDFLAGRTAIVVGQSGVGKSTLINNLIERSVLPTDAISTSSGEGRHTTVNSVMLSLTNGGAVIDSPGVRDYAPAVAVPADVIRGFREIHEAGHGCKYANCRHLREPHCSVKASVEAGEINARRYESYKRLLSTSLTLSKR